MMRSLKEDSGMFGELVKVEAAGRKVSSRFIADICAPVIVNFTRLGIFLRHSLTEYFSN